MTTVFLSGSRNASRLNDLIRNRINNMISQGFRVIVGDANGADKALQTYLADSRYSNVVVFCSGNSCRNNVGNWDVRHVSVDPRLKGREFYTRKDKEMTAEADYGFVVWDGKSVGSLSNVLELLTRKKSVAVYFMPENRFLTLSHLDDAHELLSRCDSETLGHFRKQAGLGNAIKNLEAVQERLNAMIR